VENLWKTYVDKSNSYPQSKKMWITYPQKMWINSKTVTVKLLYMQMWISFPQ